MGELLEVEAAAADDYAAAASSGAAGRENLHRQVRTDGKILVAFLLGNFYRGLTDESEILKFLQHGTLVGLLPVPHPILIRKYQANAGTTTWFRTYMWGVIYLRNVDPPIWYDTDVKLFEIQRV